MKRIILVFSLFAVLLCGCSMNEEENIGYESSNSRNEEKHDVASGRNTGTLAESRELAQGYLELYTEAAESGSLDSLETIGAIRDLLGQSGYPTVDTGNQIDMVHPEVIREFSDSVNKGQAAETSMLLVTDDGGFVRYDLSTENRKVQVERSRVSWEAEQPYAEVLDSYEAHTWRLDEENGYLYIEKEQPAGYDGSSGYTAVRIEPLDETLRELNRKYILPVGYRRTNLFLTDWDKSDYGKLDFYDLFEVFYESEFGKNIPYTSDFDKRTYEIPAEEFEAVITDFLDVDTETLRAYTEYDSQKSAYLYCTRCREDWGHPCFVTPEVREYEELDDGTIRLLVCSVSQTDDPAHIFSHEVVVRPLPGGECQYVSNRLLPSGHAFDFDWYSQRMSAQEWEDRYGKIQNKNGP